MSELDFDPFFDEVKRRKLVNRLEREMPSFVDWRRVEQNVEALEALSNALRLRVSRDLDQCVCDASALYGGWERYEDALESLSIAELDREVRYREAFGEALRRGAEACHDQTP